MRTLILATALVLFVHTEARSENKLNEFRGGGGGFIGERNRSKLGKNYYVVRDGESGKCSIKTGDFGENPKGMVGGAPYASKKYAEDALKKFPECKGGKGGME
jgi:hypothetical protein